MGVRYLIAAMDRTQRMFGAESFMKEVQKRWPVSRTFIKDQGPHKGDVRVIIEPVDSTPFAIDHIAHNRIVTTDGSPYQSAEVAVWVRELHPDPDLALWLVDDMFNGHVVLHPGITTEEVHAGWVDHCEHDPYEEYPQYFPTE